MAFVVVAADVEGPDVDGPAVDDGAAVVGAAVVALVTVGLSSPPRRPESDPPDPLDPPPLSADAGMVMSATAATVAAQRRRVFAAEIPVVCFSDEVVERFAFLNILRPVLSWGPMVTACDMNSVKWK